MLLANMKTGTFSDRHWMMALGIGLGALLLLRIVALAFNATDLFFDEAQYWFWSLTPDFGYYSKPPLIAWIIAGFTEVCGRDEFCVRLPSPFLHTATALGVFLIGRALYDVRTGVLAALVFATLPAVSLSAGIISTDVPLLVFWSLALFAFIKLLEQGESRPWWPALLFGAAFGLGLNAKYAMAWFIVCTAVYLAMTPERRFILRDLRLWAGLALGVALIVPNIVWNHLNRWPTFRHTADNAKWEGALFHPEKALEFFGAQFGVFGPILFGALLVICYRALRQRLPESDRLLIAFSVPVIAAIVMQAFLSRAHANWAAVAYVAATVLVTATMIRDVAWSWLRASFVIHAVVLALLVIGLSLAGRIPMPSGAAPFARTLGWEAIADATAAEVARAEAAGWPFAAIVSDDRALSAELLYYLPANAPPVHAWRRSAKPKDHFEMVRPYRASVGGPVLLVTLAGNRSGVPKRFTGVEKLADRKLAAGRNATRRVTFFRLSGYKGE